MTGLRDALAFLTRLPVGGDGLLGPRRLALALPWFPLVGLLAGGVLGGVRLLADLALPAGPATVLGIVAAMLLTGALHEDGLADTADALGAGPSRERRLEVLHDSRIGSFGALAIAGAVLLSWTALAGLDGEHCLRAALVGGALARWAVLPQSVAFLPARSVGAAARLEATPVGVAIGTVIAIAVAFVFAGWGTGAEALGVAALVTAGSGAAASRAFGGLTGDTYGAAAKLVELCVYLTLVAAWS